MAKRELTCCVCGGPAGSHVQHWNRDTGFGICARCVADEAGKSTPEELVSRYGTAGVNYEQPTVKHYGRVYKVLATFANTGNGQAAANAFMSRNPNASVLCITDAVYLADVADQGVEPRS